MKVAVRILFLLMFLLVFSGCEIEINVNGPNDQGTEEQGTEDDGNDNGVDDSTNDDGTDTNGDENGIDDDGTDGSDSGDDPSDTNGDANDNGTSSNDDEPFEGISVKSYLPMEVGYVHNVGGNVPDGFGEYVEVIGAQNDYFLAVGGSTAMGFYRLYQVNDQEAVILFEANEEHAEYQDIEAYVSGGNMDEAITYAIDNSNMNFVLIKGPIEPGTTWDDAVIMDTHVVALQTDDTSVDALLVQYDDREENRYFEEGVGLVGIVHYSQDVQDLFGEAVYAKNIVD
ncbi:hypothetical protein [Evansella tamaricis]|uniref:Uncharacterized protein n=1 Tax=Evansella tamaricis TaxID=2069301 RepID=A0ABS6JHD5_9BACI|nr:hypothetical protein [Evansella tamaricis]MBU9713086.1 hypothetical protein [Evansella tamaricis]